MLLMRTETDVSTVGIHDTDCTRKYGSSMGKIDPFFDDHTRVVFEEDDTENSE